MATDLWPMGRSASNARDTQKAQVQIGKNGCRIGWFLVNGCMFWYLKKRIVSHQESPPYANLVNSQGGCLKTGYSVPSHGESWFSPWSLPYFGCKCLHVWTIDVILLVIVYPIISHYLPLQYIQFTYIIYHVYIYVQYIYIYTYVYILVGFRAACFWTHPDRPSWHQGQLTPAMPALVGCLDGKSLSAGKGSLDDSQRKSPQWEEWFLQYCWGCTWKFGGASGFGRMNSSWV